MISVTLNSEIEKRFTPQELTAVQRQRIAVVRSLMMETAIQVSEAIGDEPMMCREHSIALTKLEEASHWAVKAIARRP